MKCVSLWLCKIDQDELYSCDIGDLQRKQSATFTLDMVTIVRYYMSNQTGPKADFDIAKGVCSMSATFDFGQPIAITAS